jgi:hypothetical protein
MASFLEEEEDSLNTLHAVEESAVYYMNVVYPHRRTPIPTLPATLVVRTDSVELDSYSLQFVRKQVIENNEVIESVNERGNNDYQAVVGSLRSIIHNTGVVFTGRLLGSGFDKLAVSSVVRKDGGKTIISFYFEFHLQHLGSEMHSLIKRIDCVLSD